MKAVIGGMLALAFASAAAQQSVRDARPAPVVGRGAISGIVVTGEANPRPMRGAHVTLGGARLLGGRIVITDASGTFRFGDLPPGRFTLSASKPAYLATAYGATRPSGAGVPLALADGGALTDLTLVLHKGGVISGRLVDHRGRPQPATSVSAMRYSWFTGTRELLVHGSAVSDNRGEYRIFGLLSGEYIVRATRSIGGDIHTIAPGEIDAALDPQRSPASAPPSPDATFGASPVYYPGTHAAADAAVVSVALGEEAGGIDFALRYVPTARIAGTVVGGAGSPESIQVRLLGATGRVGISTPSTAAVAQPDGAHAFAFSGIAPGQYLIMAFKVGPAGNAGGAVEWGSAAVDINGRHIDGLELRLQTGLTVSGRVVFEDSGGEPPPGGWMVRLSPVLSMTEGAVYGTPAPVAADGSFTVRGVTPARYRVSAISRDPVDAGGRTWVTKSATAHGIDVLDVPADLRAGADIADVVVTISTRRSELSGTLQAAGGEPAPAFFVIAFPANRAFWTPYSRHVKSTRPGTDGKYRFVDLPAADYYVAALTDVEQGEWLNPDFLEKLIPASARIALADGEKKTLNLRTVK